ncbi:MAG: AzlD domain-containing protein [Gammaproteobacteria bacterium]|nr:AzlD domain-containing protein [Gammaproteobacteria bacterium]
MSTDEFLLIGGMALITFAIRYALFGAGHRVRFPAWLAHALNYVPVAVLSAIIAPAVLLPDGQHWDLSLHNAHLVGALAAILIAATTRHQLATIAGGMLCFMAWRWIMP